jgi:hypothetical protein
VFNKSSHQSKPRLWSLPYTRRYIALGSFVAGWRGVWNRRQYASVCPGFCRGQRRVTSRILIIPLHPYLCAESGPVTTSSVSTCGTAVLLGCVRYCRGDWSWAAESHVTDLEYWNSAILTSFIYFSLLFSAAPVNTFFISFPPIDFLYLNLSCFIILFIRLSFIHFLYFLIPYRLFLAFEIVFFFSSKCS